MYFGWKSSKVCKFEKKKWRRDRSNTSASYLDLKLSFGRYGQLYTSISDNLNNFNFHVTSFPFLSSKLHLQRPMAFSANRLYDMPRIGPHMNVLFWGPGDFPQRYSNKETMYITECSRLKFRTFLCPLADLIKHYEVSLSRML